MQTKEFVYLLLAVCFAMVLYAVLRRRQRTGTTPENKDALLQEYLKAGIDYHTSARFAAFAGFMPLSGNLAHHSVEMYLKGYLCRKLSERERRNLGHRLRKIWKRFKEEVGDSSLARFDTTISAIDKFERIRYPEEIIRKGMGATALIVGRMAMLTPTTASGSRWSGCIQIPRTGRTSSPGSPMG
jgi:HEPN domain-containing protein